jgi:phosphatidylglycerophosphate synthase
MKWCGDGGSFELDPLPSSCVCETLVTGGVNGLFLIIFLVRFYELSAFVEPYQSIGLKNTRELTFLQYAMTVLGVSFLSCLAVGPSHYTPSLVFYIVTQAVLWVLAALLVYEEGE